MAGTQVDVVIADDQELLRAGFSLILGAQPGIRVVGEAADGVECIELAHVGSGLVSCTGFRRVR